MFVRSPRKIFNLKVAADAAEVDVAVAQRKRNRSMPMPMQKEMIARFAVTHLSNKARELVIADADRKDLTEIKKPIFI